jgi:hypothetical protein
VKRIRPRRYDRTYIIKLLHDAVTDMHDDCLLTAFATLNEAQVMLRNELTRRRVIDTPRHPFYKRRKPTPPDCPNDRTRMVMVTYREQLEVYAERLKEEVDLRDALLDALRTAKPYIEFYAEREMNSPSNNQQAVIETREMLRKVRKVLEEDKVGT